MHALITLEALSKFTITPLCIPAESFIELDKISNLSSLFPANITHLIFTLYYGINKRLSIHNPLHVRDVAVEKLEQEDIKQIIFENYIIHDKFSFPYKNLDKLIYMVILPAMNEAKPKL